MLMFLHKLMRSMVCTVLAENSLNQELLSQVFVFLLFFCFFFVRSAAPTGAVASARFGLSVDLA